MRCWSISAARGRRYWPPPANPSPRRCAPHTAPCSRRARTRSTARHWRPMRWPGSTPHAWPRCCARPACQPPRSLPSARMARPSGTGPACTTASATRARASIRRCWPNSPASTWWRTSAAATSPPAARAHHWCRRCIMRCSAATPRPASPAISAAFPISASCLPPARSAVSTAVRAMRCSTTGSTATAGGRSTATATGRPAGASTMRCWRGA
ncbi:hypothetical protein D9M72_388520 [compost metagenome]